MQRLDILVEALEANDRLVQMALKDLGGEYLNIAPKPDCNSIGWLLWHQARTEDSIISQATGGGQVWVEAGWHKKFGMEADLKNTGLGHTPQRVAAFKAPDIETLKGYAAAVRARTKDFLGRATEADLDRMLPYPFGGGMRKVSSFLAILLVDYLQHSGQIAYLRGFFTGKGWLPF